MTCGVCNGTGKVRVVVSTCSTTNAVVTCPNCNGNGIVLVAR